MDLMPEPEGREIDNPDGLDLESALAAMRLWRAPLRSRGRECDALRSRLEAVNAIAEKLLDEKQAWLDDRQKDHARIRELEAQLQHYRGGGEQTMDIRAVIAEAACFKSQWAAAVIRIRELEAVIAAWKADRDRRVCLCGREDGRCAHPACWPPQPNTVHQPAVAPSPSAALPAGEGLASPAPDPLVLVRALATQPHITAEPFPSRALRGNQWRPE